MKTVMMKRLAMLAALTLATTAQAQSANPAMQMGDHAVQVADAATYTLGDLTIAGAFTRATLPNAPVAGGFLTVTNASTEDDTLTGASTAIAGMTQVHEMAMQGDVMKMRELPDGLVIPAGQTVTLQPGGFHLMFMDLTQPLVEGEDITVTLTFAKAGQIDVVLPVGNRAAKMGH